jgi:hypothetical protein
VTSTDLHRTLDSAAGTFLALMLLEGLVKPIARRLTQYLTKKLDERIRILPDWLYKTDRTG